MAINLDSLTTLARSSPSPSTRRVETLQWPHRMRLVLSEQCLVHFDGPALKLHLSLVQQFLSSVVRSQLLQQKTCVMQTKLWSFPRWTPISSSWSNFRYGFGCNERCLLGNSTWRPQPRWLPYIILDWRSFRLPRVSRSSLNAESQACVAAMDSLEYTRTLIQGCLNADYTLQSPGEWVISKTALVVDAKALSDSIRAEIPHISGDKRTKIEVMIVKKKDARVPSTFAMGFKWSTVCWWYDKTLSTSVAHWPPSNTHVQIASRCRWRFRCRKEENSTAKRSKCPQVCLLKSC